MEYILGAATILGGIAAIWYFWDKLAGLFKRQPIRQDEKPQPANLDLDSILQVIGDSAPSEWNYYDPQAKYYFKNDVQLTIDREPGANNQFPEAWAHRFPDRSAHAVKFTIYYGATPIKDFWAVEVDGGRSYIPYPKSADVLTISHWEYAVGRVINIANGNYSFDDYLGRAGIRVVRNGEST